MKLALVGLGYWGPNLLRTLNSLHCLSAAFDMNAEKLKKYADDPAYGAVFFDTDWERCLGRDDVDGVVIATPPNTHYNIAIQSLQNNKHVFIEKPMTLNVVEAEKILHLSQQLELIVMVGHIFLYSPEIIKLKEVVSSPAFGGIRYIYTQRLNLGGIQSPANVIEDLAPHDISVFNYLLDDSCEKVQSFGRGHVLSTEDVAFVNMRYKKGTMCHMHLSWLDPLKIRKTVIVGGNQMAVCDSAAKTIAIYNNTVDLNALEQGMSESYARHLLTYKYGDMVMPYIPLYEPLTAECKEFIKCIEEKRQPLSGAEMGVEIVKTLAAMQKSIKKDGRWVVV